MLKRIGVLCTGLIFTTNQIWAAVSGSFSSVAAASLHQSGHQECVLTGQWEEEEEDCPVFGPQQSERLKTDYIQNNRLFPGTAVNMEDSNSVRNR